MKTRYHIATLVALFAAIPSFGQNLDPTVNVTKSYEGKLLEVDKPSLMMTVPDSVTRFNLDFDYSVLESKYKGSNEFNPYLLNIRPEEAADKPSRLWLRLGAGYSLHPELDLVWSVFQKPKFTMDVYATSRTYYGNYFDMTAADEPDYTILRPNGTFGKPERHWEKWGLDSYNKAGVDGKVNWETGSFFFDANYTGYANKDTQTLRDWNGLNVTLGAKGNYNDATYIYYDAALRYRFGQQDFKAVAETSVVPDGSKIGEHRLSSYATVGPVISYNHAALLDVNLDLSIYRSDITDGPNAHAGRISFTPKYVYKQDRLRVEAGVKLEMLMRPDEAGTKYSQTKGQVAYPRVKVDYAAIEDYLNVYFRADGGADINSYSDLLDKNHWFNASYANGNPLLDNTIERANVSVGVNGNLFSRLSYDVTAGYVNYKNAPVESIVKNEKADPATCMPVILYTAYQTAFAKASFAYNTDRIDLDGSLLWRYSFYGSKVAEEERLGFLASPLVGNVKFMYNWKRRIYAGASLEGALTRKGFISVIGADDSVNRVAAKIPGYLDLGLDFEYKVNSKFGVWGKIGNLGHMTIQKTPLYSECGPYFNVGISVLL